MLSDTHPDAERVQIELLRKMAPSQRLDSAIDLTAVTFELSRQTITAQNPKMKSREINLRCVRLYYGEELARRLDEYLAD